MIFIIQVIKTEEKPKVEPTPVVVAAPVKAQAEPAAAQSPKVDKKKAKPAAQPQSNPTVAAIQAAITDNNNNNTSDAKKASSATSSPKPSTSKQAASSKAVNISNLKQTNLSESMILIEQENNLVQKTKVNIRTESNQSSSESLQDIEGEEGEYLKFFSPVLMFYDH